MKFSHKFGYIALGGALMLIGMIASSIFMPNLIAQRDKFGEIECTGLVVLGPDGNETIRLGNSPDQRDASGYIAIFDRSYSRNQGILLTSSYRADESLPSKYKEVDFRISVYNFGIFLNGHNGKAIDLTTTGMGGSIKLIGGEHSKSEITLINGEGDGLITILNKDAKSGLVLTNGIDGGNIEIIKDNKTQTKLNVKEHGANLAMAGHKGNIGIGFGELGGAVIISDNDFNPRAVLTDSAHGGTVTVQDKGGNTRASLAVDEIGGTVGVYSNNGKIQASLEEGNNFGGKIRVFDNIENAIAMLGARSLDGNTSAGNLTLSGTDGKLKAVLGAKNGNGYFEISGKLGNTAVLLGSSDFGGQVRVHDVFENPKTGLGIDQHGNGRFFTLDKNGNPK
ncbi:MAG: hypothetical protein OXP71_11400 [Candidatus Poribacteria bacterium]|nr:hypothetical protein [Candidatus Poribacteria bacterium]